MPCRREAAAVWARLRRVREPWWVLSATLFSLIVTIWWLGADNQVPDFDEGMHLTDAIIVHTQLQQGHLTAPFTDFDNYPPLVHLVGAIGFLIAGLHESAALLAQSIFFLPMLAGGCYAAGTMAYNRRAGLCAALLALSAPMWVSEMHEFYVDPGEAAMVAASVGAILWSRRFERVGVSALAGLLVTLGMLTKQTFVLFVGGLVVVVVLRGGWRNWRGLIAFLAVGATLALPWYIYHYDQLSLLTQGATSTGIASGNANAGNGITPARSSAANISWYFWNLVNHQLLAPLTLFFLVGTALALWRFARKRDPDDLTPELFVGGLVGYLGVTYINLKDPRYSLPELIYVAVLATGWITQIQRRHVRRLAIATFAALAATNFAMVSFGWGSPVTWTIPGPHGSSVNGARTLTFFSPGGWLHGGPVEDGDLLGLIEALKRLHFRYVEFDGGSANIPDFSQNGLGVLTIEADLPEPAFGYNLALLTTHDAFILRRFAQAGDPPPCQRMVDGSGVYVEVGNPVAAPFEEYHFICPGRKPLYYQRTVPLSEDLTHVITGEPRQALVSLFRALRRSGVRTVQYDASMIASYEGEVFMENVGLQTLAATVGVTTGPYNPAGNGPHEGFLLDHTPVKGDPPPCVKLPGGQGVYVVLGSALIPFADYRFYCPLPKPHFYSRAAG